MTGRRWRFSALALSALALTSAGLGALASSAYADVVAPPECPHAMPREGDRCEPPAAAACVYHQERGATACTCTNRRWHCAPLPPAPPSADS